MSRDIIQVIPAELASQANIGQRGNVATCWATSWQQNRASKCTVIAPDPHLQLTNVVSSLSQHDCFLNFLFARQ